MRPVMRPTAENWTPALTRPKKKRPKSTTIFHWCSKSLRAEWESSVKPSTVGLGWGELVGHEGDDADEGECGGVEVGPEEAEPGEAVPARRRYGQ